MKYFNIHTHNAVSIDDNCVFIKNIIVGRDSIPENTLFSAGIHPWYIEDDFEKQFQLLVKYSSSPACIMIGECGLDKNSDAEEQLQEKVFDLQIKLAIKTEKPLIIHCVKKFTEVKKMLESNTFSLPFIMHGINTNPENSKPFFSIPNAFFSFGAALLHNDSNAEQIFRELPLEKCFLETDDKEADIKKMYLRAAEIRNISVEDLAERIEQNSKQIFKDAGRTG